MPGNFFLIAQEDHPPPIRGNVRKPVVKFVRGDLFLCASVRPHTPDLHGPGAVGVKVNVLAVGRILGPVVEPLGGSQAGFIATCDRNGVDIEVPIPLSDEGKRSAIR